MTELHISERLRGETAPLRDLRTTRRNALLYEAASHIEKLEALVEQLRDDNSSMIDDYDTDFLRQENRIEKLEAALWRIRLHSREAWECKIAKEALDAK